MLDGTELARRLGVLALGLFGIGIVAGIIVGALIATLVSWAL